MKSVTLKDFLMLNRLCIPGINLFDSFRNIKKINVQLELVFLLKMLRISLVVKWLRFHASPAEGMS